jgi:ABC-type sugar transport system permease subunit
VTAARVGLWPIVLSIEVSLTASATALKPSASSVGFANYAAVLNDPLFRDSLVRTLAYTALAVVTCVGFGDP